MSVSNTGGIKTLLEAESKAQEIVQAARTYRSQKVKAAKADAAKEIEEYKQKKESEFQAIKTQSSSADADVEKLADSGSKEEIKAFQATAEKGKPAVVKILMNYATGA